MSVNSMLIWLYQSNFYTVETGVLMSVENLCIFICIIKINWVEHKIGSLVTVS